MDNRISIILEPRDVPTFTLDMFLKEVGLTEGNGDESTDSDFTDSEEDEESPDLHSSPSNSVHEHSRKQSLLLKNEKSDSTRSRLSKNLNFSSPKPRVNSLYQSADSPSEKITSLRTQVNNLEFEIDAAKASLLCIVSPLYTSNAHNLDLDNPDDQFQIYFKTLVSIFKYSKSKLRESDFDSMREEIQRIYPITCLENERNLLIQNKHPVYKGNEVKIILDNIGGLVKEYKDATTPPFKCSLQVLVSNISFVDKEKWLVPKKEYFCTVDLFEQQLKSHVYEVDTDTDSLEWKEPMKFETLDENSKFIVALHFKKAFSTTKVMEASFILKDVMQAHFRYPEANWGKNSCIFELQFMEKDEMIAHSLIEVSLKYFKRPEYTEKYRHPNSHALYSILVKNMIQLRVKQRSNRESLNHYEITILNEFSAQHAIAESVQNLELLSQILETNNNRVIVVFGDFLLSSYMTLNNEYRKMMSIEVETKFCRLESLLMTKVDTILQNYMEYFVLRKQSEKLVPFYHLFRHFFPRDDLYKQVIVIAVENDYQNVFRQMYSSEKIGAPRLFQVLSALKQHLLLNDVMSLFPSEKDDLSCEVLIHYYDLMILDFDKVLSCESKANYASFYVLKLCELISMIEASIVHYCTLKKKPFVSKFDNKCSGPFIDTWIKEMQPHAAHIIKSGVASDHRATRDSLYRQSFCELMNYYLEMCSLIKTLNIKDRKVLQGFSDSFRHSCSDYVKELTEIPPVSLEGILSFDNVKFLSRDLLTGLNSAYLAPRFMDSLILHYFGDAFKNNDDCTRRSDEATSKLIEKITNEFAGEVSKTISSDQTGYDKYFKALNANIEIISRVLFKPQLVQFFRRLYDLHIQSMITLLKQNQEFGPALALFLRKLNYYFEMSVIVPKEFMDNSSLPLTKILPNPRSSLPLESSKPLEIIEIESKVSITKRFGLYDQPYERFACRTDLKGYIYIFRDHFCYEDVYNFRSIILSVAKIANISKSRKGLKIKTVLDEEFIFYDIVDMDRVWALISEKVKTNHRRIGFSKEDKRFCNLFNVEERVLKAQNCRKDKIFGVLYVGSRHLGFAPDNLDINQPILIPFTKITKANKTYVSMSLKPTSQLNVSTLDAQHTNLTFTFLTKEVDDIFQVLMGQCGKRLSTSAKPVFGVGFNDVIKFKDTLLPLPMVRVIKRVETSIKTKGIYRESGSAKQIEKIVQEYNRGVDPNLDQYDVNTICSLLNFFFLEMPKGVSLCTPQFSKDASAALQSKELSSQIEEFSKAVSGLPEVNRKILAYLALHMSNIVGASSFNLMTEKNLAVVFVPIIFKGGTNWKDILVQQELIVFLIQHQEKIFKNDQTIIVEEQVTNNTKVVFKFIE